MASTGSSVAAAVLSWLSSWAAGAFVFHWSASEILGPRLHLYMKTPLMWATLSFSVGEQDTQVGFAFLTDRPVFSSLLILSKGLKSTLLLHS